MKTKIWVVMISSALLFVLGVVHAGAQEAGKFPTDWKGWTKVTSPLVKIGALPGCDADVSSLPPIYQETVATYCSVKQGGPGKVAILVNPKSAGAYNARSGKYANGNNLILHLKDMKVLFVTSHKGGAPSYNIYTEEGKKINAAQGPLSPKTCIDCHTGYQAFCVAGQCGKAVK